MAGRRVFISYSYKDREVARLIDASLRAAGVSAFLDEREVKVGDLITDKIYEGASSSTDLLYIISENSITSKWTREELGIAEIRQKQEEGFGILPVLIDSARIPISLTSLRYVDMRAWQDANQYRVAMLDLLRALAITPGRIDARQLQWWIQNYLKLALPRQKIVDCYQAADIMISYYHYFKFGTAEPYRWVWNWIHQEIEIRSNTIKLIEIIEPALPLGGRFQIIHDTARQLLEDVESVRFDRPFDGYRAETTMRSILTATGRITGVISELETEALAAAFSIVDFGESP